MGYHVTILRSAAGKQQPIALDEARAAAASIDGWECVDSPPTFALEREERTLTLWYNDGELWTKNPDAWGLDQMVRLAGALDARVRGDEFETYSSSDETYSHPDDVQLGKEAEAASKLLLKAHLREQRVIRNGIIAFFVALAAIGYFIGKWFETP
jgi:hypothetical protein